MGRKRTACKRCSAIKTICSKEQPCSRCKRLSLSCEYSSDSQLLALASSPTESAKIRVDHKRSSKGCVSCLYRHKKCDEKLPVCGDCRRLSLSCVPRERHTRRSSVSIKPQTKRLKKTTKSPDTGASSNIQPQSNTTNTNSIEFSANSISKSDTLSSRHASVPYAEWIDLIYEEGSLKASRKDNLNDSNALIAVSDGKTGDDAPSLGTMQPVIALNKITGVTPNLLIDWPIGERHLLNHFQQVVSRALVVVDDDENPFLLEIVPMIFTYAPVRHALMALSACQLSKVYADFQSDVLRHRNLALEGLKNEVALQSSIRSALATTLLLCLLEICECSSRKWILYLRGAKALISSNTKEPIDYSLRFLYKLYSFLSCIINFTYDGCTETHNYVQVFPVGIQKQRKGSKLMPLTGVANDLYDSLDKINELASRRASRYDTESTRTEFLLRAQDIELTLQSWTPGTSRENNKAFQEANAAAMAIQWAALMRLHQVVCGNEITHPKIQTAVENILSALSLIRPGSKAESHILLPLFMAGVGSTSKANRLTVEYRLKIMEATVGFGNIIGAHKLLDSLWQSMNEGVENLDWEMLMRREFAGVVLL